MKKIIYVLLLVVVLLVIRFVYVRLHIPESSDNNISSYTSGDFYFTIDHDGMTREFVVHVPKSYKPEQPLPLLLMFHGGGGNIEHAITQTGLNVTADESNFIVMYAQGVSGPFVRLVRSSGGSWNSGPIGGGYSFKNDIDDVGFVENAIEFIQERFSIDAKKIYATGFSMGGMMTYRLACELSDVITAIAPVGTNMALPPEDCNPDRPVPVIHFQGKKDRMIPFGGGNTDEGIPKAFVVGGPYPSIQSTIDFWREHNICDEVPVSSFVNGEARCVVYMGCAENASVSLCTAETSGHTWPGGTVVNNTEQWNEYVGKTTTDMSANTLMWKFLSSYSLP